MSLEMFCILTTFQGRSMKNTELPIRCLTLILDCQWVNSVGTLWLCHSSFTQNTGGSRVFKSSERCFIERPWLRPKLLPGRSWRDNHSTVCDCYGDIAVNTFKLKLRWNLNSSPCGNKGQATTVTITDRFNTGWHTTTSRPLRSLQPLPCHCHGSGGHHDLTSLCPLSVKLN